MKKKLLPWLIVIAIISFLVFLALLSKTRLNNVLAPDSVRFRTGASISNIQTASANASFSESLATVQPLQKSSKHEIPDKYFIPQSDQNTRVAIKSILQKSIAMMQSEQPASHTGKQAIADD
ncbi:MAG TPA: hypothetical protein DCG57_10230 [Candidatus Riflebacteria bacterium]|jgi:hypothetical protein|nr:hypothetical protein [Candidatus Riflebacteria bacterium]